MNESDASRNALSLHSARALGALGGVARLVRASSASIARRALVLAVMGAALAGASGCGTVQPYERGKLAHPTMTAGDMAGFGESHLRAITEGATGGSGGTGSGCGCN
jgi:uncharacterized protein DUF4266